MADQRGSVAERHTATAKVIVPAAAQPGYVDTALHQSVTPGAEFQFVNIARWQTAEDFQRATQSAGFRESAAGLAPYRPHPGLYRVVRT